MTYINLTNQNFSGAFGTSVPLPDHTFAKVINEMLFKATFAIYTLDAFAIMIMQNDTTVIVGVHYTILMLFTVLKSDGMATFVN